MKRILMLGVAAAICLSVTASAEEAWTSEQKAAWAHLENVWETLQTAETVPATYDRWSEVVNPTREMLWWWTSFDGVPVNRDALRSVLNGRAPLGIKPLWYYLQPVAVRIHGDTVMFFYYSRGESINEKGERNTWKDVRLEVYRKTKDGYTFLGGMVDSKTVPDM